MANKAVGKADGVSMNANTQVCAGIFRAGIICIAVWSGRVSAEVKDPLPDSLSLGGVTLYATIDVGFAFQSHGVPLSSEYPTGLEYQTFTTTRNFAGSQTTFAENGIEQSKVGLRVSEPISDDLTLVAGTDTGFNPLSGQLVDACKSLAANSGKPQGAQNTNADSSRCGQAFNGVIWGGVNSLRFGGLSIGRQQSLQLNTLAVYDPQGLAYAFSFLGYSGFNAGAGSTQSARLNNSGKYVFATGPLHFSGMYSTGGSDTGVLGRAGGAAAGLTFKGLSADVVYQRVNGAVNLRGSFDNVATPLPTPGLAAYISNNTSYNLMVKDTLGFRDQKDKLSMYAGYSYIEKSHADYTGGSAQNDYPISVGININDSVIYRMEWIGARYARESGWNFMVGLYHVSQSRWSVGKGSAGKENISCPASGSVCAGDFYEGSLVSDFAINKHYDLYAGVNWSEVTDGLAAGYHVGVPGTTGSQNQTTLMCGFRLRI